MLFLEVTQHLSMTLGSAALPLQSVQAELKDFYITHNFIIV